MAKKGKKGGKKGDKGKKAPKTPTMLDGIPADEMTQEQLVDHMVNSVQNRLFTGFIRGE